MSKTEDKVATFEKFINTKLKQDLSEVEILLKKKVEEYKSWQELKNFIEHIQNRSEDESDELTTTFNMGCDIYAIAKIENFEKIIVNIGCNCYLEMYYDEAVKYVDLRLKYLKKDVDFARQQAAFIKAHIKLVLLAIGELQSNKS